MTHLLSYANQIFVICVCVFLICFSIFNIKQKSKRVFYWERWNQPFLASPIWWLCFLWIHVPNPATAMQWPRAVKVMLRCTLICALTVSGAQNYGPFHVTFDPKFMYELPANQWPNDSVPSIIMWHPDLPGQDKGLEEWQPGRVPREQMMNPCIFTGFFLGESFDGPDAGVVDRELQ